jgi:hypothetical protein
MHDSEIPIPQSFVVSKPKDATGQHACHLYGNMNKSFHLHYLATFIDKNFK